MREPARQLVAARRSGKLIHEAEEDFFVDSAKLKPNIEVKLKSEEVKLSTKSFACLDTVQYISRKIIKVRAFLTQYR